MTPAVFFERHPVVAIDSNVLIYLFEGHGALADAAAALLDGIEDGTASGVLASIGLTEVLTRPASLGDAALFERYADELRSIPHLRIVPLDTETAIDAAWGRGGGGPWRRHPRRHGAPRRCHMLHHQRPAGTWESRR